ncbi:hypothetical protein N7E81_14830 [Reichenbachiella carrageenanivorans]|uniref:DUF4168 domain-containing protein n=1 Tax=Reichenbachiella carrageenanivorans TaxID=2979869 RepID=A0ABY6CZ02_9BACT|nr:hypothetical protein [Reichenbachiella carrageenanivorans]UXX78634.1 hypothetical protein N7E81_14830 [Reichenbachiella carrageenanivorans]
MKSVKLKNSLLVFGMLVACLAICPKTMAQDGEVTSEELTLYAQVTAKIDTLKSNMKAQISEAVKSNELMDGGRMYNELNKAKGDETKIAESGATEEQIAAYAQIQKSIEAFKAEFKEQYTGVVKDEIGAGTYNKVKKALKADAAVKAQYDEIVASMATASEEATEGEG